MVRGRREEDGSGAEGPCRRFEISCLKVHSLVSIKDLRIIGSVRCILLELDLFFCTTLKFCFSFHRSVSRAFELGYKKIPK